MQNQEAKSRRNCLCSIVAVLIAEKLVEDGLPNAPLYRKQKKTGDTEISYFATSGYYDATNASMLTENSRHLEESPIWYPSFISRESWINAVEMFRYHYSIKYNVEHYLIPELGPQIECISGEELASVARQFLLDQGILCRPVRQLHGDTYYFGEDEIYHVDDGSSQSLCEGRNRYRAFQLMDYDSFNAKVWNRAVRQFSVGMTLLECAKLFASSELEYRAAPQWSMIDRLIQRISSPKYERVPGNTNTATFDRIRIVVSLPRYLFPTWNDLKQAVVDNRKEIDRQVLGKIETDYRFKKYGIPINTLRLSEIVLRNDYALEYIFELKE